MTKDRKVKKYRVGALIGSKEGIVEFLGYGVYEGDFPLPKEAGGFNFGQDNPRIKLDNGDIVYGCECWWGEEKEFKKKYIDTAKEIKLVKIADVRKRKELRLMDNRLQEAIKWGLEAQCFMNIKEEHLQTLISYAEQGLKLEGVIPKKMPIWDATEKGKMPIGLKLDSEGYNRAIDDCTHALIQKLDVELIAEVIQGGHWFIADVVAQELAASIKNYLAKEAV